METRLEAMEQQVFKCQGMVEHGLNANHMMITEITNNHKMDAIDIGKNLVRLYDRVDQLQGQIYDLQNQNSVEPPALQLLLPPPAGKLSLHQRGIENLVIPARLGKPGAAMSTTYWKQLETLHVGFWYE
ncbi:40S ribosomal protein S5-1 [Hordeum vulgare]|nr:40S ribosomal protein S5-1 [Hordeum vulgare]